MSEQNPINDNNIYELQLRQLEAASNLLIFLYNVHMHYKQKNVTIYNVSYLIDLLCNFLMNYYRGDTEMINLIQSQSKKEMKEFIEQQSKKVNIPEVDKVKSELKELGINFNLLYDPEKKKTYPNIDINKLYIPEEKIDEWMRNHMDEVLDRYIKKLNNKKKKKDEE